MKKHSITYNFFATLLFIATTLCHGYSQDTRSFPGPETKKASKYAKKGNRAYRSGFINEALQNYKAFQQINSVNSEVNLKLAKCYLLINDGANAVLYSEKAISNYTKPTAEMYFIEAQAFHLNSNFEKAISAYETYKTKINRNEKSLIAQIDKKIEECNNGIELSVNLLNLNIKHLDGAINTMWPEYNAFLMPDSSMIIYTASKKDNRGGLRRFYDNGFYDDVYYSVRLGNNWQKPENLSAVNGRANDATAGISTDGKQLFIVKDNNGGDLYVSNFVDGQWQKPLELKGEINSEWYEGSASLTADGKTLYFISSRPKTNKGGKDIFSANWNTNTKSWKKPVNIGKVVNSKYDEQSVCTSQSGDTLYFSSNGHNSIGGFDIFITIKNGNGEWSVPENLGIPINTTSDDIFFNISGKYAYYSHPNPGNVNNYDIYSIPLNSLRSKKQNSDTIDLRKNTVSSNFNVIRDTSIIKNEVLVLNDNSNDENKIEKELKKNINDFFKGDAEIKGDTIIPVVQLMIEFEKSSANIKKSFYPAIDSLAKKLIDSQDLKLLIYGHTDNISSYEYNLNLSEKRAKSVADLLRERKIPGNQIEYKGFSYSLPIANNSTPEGRSINRRVEFKYLRIKK